MLTYDELNIPNQSGEDLMYDHLKNLETVNFQLAELKLIKEKIEAKILSLSGRVTYSDNETIASIDKDGAETHFYGKYKVTIGTSYIYSIDKDEYAVLKNRISPLYCPIKEVVKVEVDKRKLRECERYASEDELLVLSQIITKKFAKPTVKITANI